MRLSHKKKLAHKRSGSAKGWAFVLLTRKWRRDGVTIAIKSPFGLYGPDYGAMLAECVGEVASSPASVAPDSVDDANAPCIDADVAAAMQEVARSAEHAGSLMNKLVGAVASTFRRLREAGAAQADIIRGRIG
jgi:hypothetical protein